jgi:hypothetical protein
MFCDSLHLVTLMLSDVKVYIYCTQFRFRTTTLRLNDIYFVQCYVKEAVYRRLIDTRRLLLQMLYEAKVGKGSYRDRSKSLASQTSSSSQSVRFSNGYAKNIVNFLLVFLRTFKDSKT